MFFHLCYFLQLHLTSLTLKNVYKASYRIWTSYHVLLANRQPENNIDQSY